MAAYAMLNLSKIDLTRTKSNVVIDGLYSWEEYAFLKTYLHEDFYVLAVYAAPRTRYRRLKNRVVRPLTAEEAASRDAAEIVNLNKAGPIALADFTIINESTLKNLKKEVKNVITRLSRL
jgi:dephospho-CoA kinase